ncbi:MAG: hypothetical protein HS111_28880 [Kofleriaceae bacterium]|nr:hypothetical protein [Kofleriaceae bacterium]
MSERVAFGIVLVALLVTCAWLWRERSNAIRERDYAGRKINQTCNEMTDLYRGAAILAEDAKTGQRRIGGVDFAPLDAAGLAARLVDHARWLDVCSNNAEEAGVLVRDLATRLRGIVLPGDVPLLENEPAGIPDVVEQLRKLVPMRDVDDRSWARTARER